MIKYFQTVTNARGDVLPGYRLQALDSTGAVVTIYADKAGTRFTDVSGNFVNYSVADADGLAEFYWTPATGQTLQLLDQSGNLYTSYPDFADGFVLGNLGGEIAQESVTDLPAALAAKVATSALAAPTGTNLIGTKAPGAGAIDRTLQDKLHEGAISIKDFGAVGDGVADDTAAFHAAMQAAMDRFANDLDFYEGGPGQPYDIGFSEVDRRTGRIFVPAGVYNVQDSAFSSLDDPRAPFVGFEFVGEHRYSSIINLNEPGHFYDNGVGQNKFQAVLFRNIGFRSSDYATGNGFRIWSDGGPKQFRFEHCDFQNLNQFIETHGTGNADLFKVICCTGLFYGDILTLNNGQSVQHDFIGSDLGTYGNFVRVKQYGGGNVNVINGSIDFLWHEDFSPAGGNFMFTHDTDANIGQGNCTFAFRDCRVEVEAYKRTAGAPPLGIVQTQPKPNDAFARVLFDNVNFVNGLTYTIDAGGAITGSERRRITAVDLNSDKYVEFRNCVMLKNFFYEVGGDSRNGPAQGGVLVFDGCYDGVNSELPAADAALTSLASRVIKSGSCGRVITRNMTEHTGGSSFIRYVLDYDPYWDQAISREPSATVKLINLKHPNNGWPFTANASNDHYLQIPPGFEARKIYVRKPASGSSTTPYRLRVGNHDKSVVYGSSTTAQFKDEHVIDLSRIDLTGQTQLRLWADDGAGGGAGTDFDNGGYAEVEYI